MDRIAGKEHAPITIPFRDQQVMAPRNDVTDLEIAGKADQAADNRREIGIRWQRRMQSEFLAVALRDHAGAGRVGELVMASLAGHDPLVQVSERKMT